MYIYIHIQYVFSFWFTGKWIIEEKKISVVLVVFVVFVFVDEIFKLKIKTKTRILLYKLRPKIFLCDDEKYEMVLYVSVWNYLVFNFLYLFFDFDFDDKNFK